VSPRDYLESALQSLPGSTPAVTSKNGIRSSIKALFPDRDCFTLVRPVNDEDALARLDALSTSQLRPEFRQGLASLTKLIFQKALPKRLGAQVVTGPALAALTEAYVAAINAGAVPTIATAWQGVAEAESRRAADAAEAAYAAAFPTDVPAEEAALEAAHQAALTEAQRAFDASALGDEAVKSANERRWREAVANRYRETKERRLATAELACERAINEAAARLGQVARAEGATLEDLQREAAAFQQRYSASKDCAGPAKWKRLADFMRDTYGAAQRDLADLLAERQRSEAAAAQAAAQAAQNAVQSATARASAAEGAAAAAQARVAALERQLAAVNAELTAARQAAAGSAAERSAAGDQVRAAREAEAAARAQAGAAAQQANALQQQLAAERARVEALQREVAQVASAGTAAWASERGRLEATIESVTAARDAAQAARAAAEAARATAEQQAAAAAGEAGRLASRVAELESAAARAPPLAPVYTAPPLQDDEMFVDASPEQAAPPAAAAPAAPAAPAEVPDPSRMTIAAMKEWLTENGHEAKVWEMSQSKAKKGDWQAFINGLRG
jgi:hypothetical protein